MYKVKGEVFMINLWLATISLGSLLMVGMALFLYAIRSSVNADDAYRIDPIPDDNNSKK